MHADQFSAPPLTCLPVKRSQAGPETIFLLARRLTPLHAPRMKKTRRIKWALAFFSGIAVACMAGGPAQAQPAEALPKAFIDGTGPGWRALGEADFKKVNCATNTWTWTNGVIYCTGQPMGVTRSQNLVTNLELVVEWQHLRSGGNSGLYLWATERSIRQLEAGEGPFPEGIEVQVLDHGYTEQYERETKKKADWFTTHGDVFPTEKARMTPFSPAAPSGMRSFPRKHLSKGVGEWNHYYVRAINGEIRLWVNGEEVSGGTGCKPAFGYLCLESEGSPVEFRNLRIRELP